MTTILTGEFPLWPPASGQVYLGWLLSHQDEIYDAYLSGDENAELLVEMISGDSDGNRWKDKHFVATLQIVTERYIHDHHPELAQIAGGYPKGYEHIQKR